MTEQPPKPSTQPSPWARAGRDDPRSVAVPDDSRGTTLTLARPEPRAGSEPLVVRGRGGTGDRKSTRLNSSHLVISYAVFCLKKKKKNKKRNLIKKKKKKKTT